MANGYTANCRHELVIGWCPTAPARLGSQRRFVGITRFSPHGSTAKRQDRSGSFRKITPTPLYETSSDLSHHQETRPQWRSLTKSASSSTVQTHIRIPSRRHREDSRDIGLENGICINTLARAPLHHLRKPQKGIGIPSEEGFADPRGA